MIEIGLTDEHIKSLQPLENKVRKAYEDGYEGSLLAQVFPKPGFAEVHFIDLITAEQIKEILRKNGYVRNIL